MSGRICKAIFWARPIQQVLKDGHLLSQLIHTGQSHVYEPADLIARREFGIVVEAISSQFRHETPAQ
jgi:hypothetical protein